MFELCELYREAQTLIIRVNAFLKAVHFADVDNRLVCAKSDLRYWCTQYRLGEATVIGGVLTIENALDALEGETI